MIVFLIKQNISRGITISKSVKYYNVIIIYNLTVCTLSLVTRYVLCVGTIVLTAVC